MISGQSIAAATAESGWWSGGVASRGAVSKRGVRTVIGAYLARAAICLALVVAGTIGMELRGEGARAQDASQIVGNWRSQLAVSGWLGFAIDIAATGNPAQPLRATGHVGRDRLTGSSCATLRPVDRLAVGLCEAIEKDGRIDVDILLAPAIGAAGFEGVHAASGASIRFALRAGSSLPMIDVELTRPRDDGTLESHIIPPLLAWADRPRQSDLAGNWIGEVAGLTIEATVSSVGADRLAVEFRYFPDGQGESLGQVLAGLGKVASKSRPFSMIADARPMPGRGRYAVFSAPVLHLPDEWQIGHPHFMYMRLPTNAELEVAVARTRNDLISMRTETVRLRPLDRAPRPVPAIPSRFEGMNGLWSGKMGPLSVELDIVVPEDGALTGEIRHFDDGNGAVAFPDGSPHGFTSALEIANKLRPFAAELAGEGQNGVPTIIGGVETGDQGDILWSTGFRLVNRFDGTLLLDYSVPNEAVEFSGPPIVLTPFGGPLRDVSTPLPPPPPSGLAGVWTWRSGATDGNLILLQLEDVDGALAGRFQALHLGGGCETFARTNAVCELARDHGPLNTAIRLEPTGNARWTHSGAHGVRAFARDLPAYSDLRLRVAEGQSTGQLLVQMTSDAAFGLGQDGTYVFERVTDTGRTNLEMGLEFEARRYDATPDDAIGGGACEAWAKRDSLLRQRGDAALTAELDTILAAQTLSVSGHPMDHQCKTMLDAYDALEERAVDAPRPPAGPGEENDADAQVALWRGSYWAWGAGRMNDDLNSFDKLTELELVVEAFEARVNVADDELFLTPSNGEARFGDPSQRGSFTVGTASSPLIRDGRTFAESFDTLFEERHSSKGNMQEATTRLRFPYPDGVVVRDYVGGDAVLWRQRHIHVYVSVDGRRVFVMHTANFGIYRYLLLTRVEETPQPPAAPEAQAPGIEGTWTRVGGLIRVAVRPESYEPYSPADETVDSFEIRASAEGRDLAFDGTVSGPLREQEVDASRIAPYLAQPTPQTGGTDVAAWLGSDLTVLRSQRHGAKQLFWGEDADTRPSENGLLLLFSGARAVAMVAPNSYGSLDFLDIPMILSPPYASIALFERSGAPAPDPVATLDPPAVIPTPTPGPTPGPGEKADASRSPVCLALERREAEIIAAADTATIQILRSIYSDAGLAFGGTETEAKCQRALDQLAGLALIGPNAKSPEPRPTGDVTTLVDQSTTLIDNTTLNQTSIVTNVVNTLDAYVGGGGALDAPDAPDACLALQPIARGLSVSGGVALSGQLGDLFLSIGFNTLDAATPLDCYRTLAVLGDLGLDPGDADNMSVVVELIDNYVPPRTTASGRLVVSPAAEKSRACQAFDAYSSALLERADTPLVQFLRGYAIENGYGMLSDREPDAASCSRMLREFVELGLDPALPDGGWSRASMLLGEGPIDSGPFAPQVVTWATTSDLQPTDGYDPRPEATREAIVLRPDFGYVVADPPPLGLRQVAADARIVAFVVPDEAVLGLVTAPENAPGFCNEGRLLSTLDGFRSYASMRELMRHLGVAPTGIRAGRDCALVETAGELVAASIDDPVFTEVDAPRRAEFDRRLDGYALTDTARALAATAIRTLATGLDYTGGAWHVLVTTPDIVEATTGMRPQPGGVVVVDARDGTILAEFRMRHGAETP